MLIGVNDNNEIIGASITNAKRSAIQNSLNEITPQLDCACYPVAVDGKEIFVIEVASGPQKPYVLSGAIYVRIGPNSQKLTTVERIGSGIKRVRDAMSEAQLPPPVFSTEGMFVATLKRPTHRRDVGEKLGEKLTKNQISIIEAILRNNKITQVELAGLVGLSTTSIDNNLRKLRHLGVVKRIGPAKGGYWEVDFKIKKK